jgi:hypothetical protein
MRVPDGVSAHERTRENSDTPDSNDCGGLPVDNLGDGEDDIGSEEGSLFGVKGFERPQQPNVQNRYWGQTEKAIARPSETRLRDGDGILTPSERHEELFNKALDAQEQILDLDLPDVESEHFGRVLTAKATVAQSVINSGLKADENRLRRENKDVMNKLWDKFEKLPDSKMIDVTPASPSAIPK